MIWAAPYMFLMRAKIKDSLHVRLAKAGETLNALTGKAYQLNETMTVIADGVQVHSLGGIMGGEESSCTLETTNVFVECALFDAIRTANTGRHLNLLSDARTRFERGVDPESQVYGLNAALSLILEWCGGNVSHLVHATHTDLAPKPYQAPLIRLTHEKLRHLSGCDISMAQAVKILDNLGFKVTYSATELEAQVPSHRLNIESATDLISEILRLHGYDNIPEEALPSVGAIIPVKTKSDIARHVLASRGFNEAVSWSFLSQEKAALFGEVEPNLVLLNPLNQELAVMRRTALPNHIDAVIRNANRGLENMQLFEVGPHFSARQQQSVVSGLRSAKTQARHWLQAPRQVDVYDAKADVMAVLKALGVGDSAYQLEASAPQYYHPGRSATVKQGNNVLAYFGELHPETAAAFETEISMVIFEFFLDNFQAPKSKNTPLSLSPYQGVTRDFAFVVKKDVKAEAIVRTIQKVDKGLITDIQIFDVYTDDKIGENHKSIAVEVKLEPTKATLTDAEINEISGRIINAVAQATEASLRQ